MGDNILDRRHPQQDTLQLNLEEKEEEQEAAVIGAEREWEQVAWVEGNILDRYHPRQDTMLLNLEE